MLIFFLVGCEEKEGKMSKIMEYEIREILEGKF